ncbi:MAG: hypothetical protein WD558_04455 [Pseudomonadales bacterium]
MATEDHEHDAAQATGTYTAIVYSTEAEMLRAYSMEATTDHISSIEEAELYVRDKLKSCTFQSLVAVITEDTVRGFNQIQINLWPTATNTL